VNPSACHEDLRPFQDDILSWLEYDVTPEFHLLLDGETAVFKRGVTFLAAGMWVMVAYDQHQRALTGVPRFQEDMPAHSGHMLEDLSTTAPVNIVDGEAVVGVDEMGPRHDLFS